MTDKPKKPLTVAEIKARSLSRWENEGGAKQANPRKKRTRDPNQLAKIMIDIATGEAEQREQTATEKQASKAVSPGGPARAKALTPERRLLKEG